MKNKVKTLLLVGVVALMTLGLTGSAFGAKSIAVQPDCPGSGQSCAFDGTWLLYKGLDK